MWWSLAVAGQTLLVTSLFTAGTCFGIDTLVTTGSGKQKLMKDLRIGEEVLSDETGSMTKGFRMDRTQLQEKSFISQNQYT